MDIETRVIDKRGGKEGNVDPRLISDAYGRLFIERKAPSNLVLVSGDKDCESLLVDYEGQGREWAYTRENRFTIRSGKSLSKVELLRRLPNVTVTSFVGSLE